MFIFKKSYHKRTSYKKPGMMGEGLRLFPMYVSKAGEGGVVNETCNKTKSLNI